MEYMTLGLVLSREEGKEADSTLHIYTREFGRVSAISRSLRKITSKLSGHLLPGRMVSVRLVERNNGGWQAVDAVSLRRMPASAETLRFLNFLINTTSLNQPDPELWEKIDELSIKGAVGKDEYIEIIDLLGLGGSIAKCANCGGAVAYFMPKDIMFMCRQCFLRSLSSEDEAVNI
ncbi:MAG: recombination protein O N-terminal domain-containing protein [Patescibacteria group bacterium]|nr:recombination protein O N-terminal domain-containing protein [Patescibacteria group bacterium]MDE2144906.1 recombination protein O N-terminal domain-containing protein [Patescibacteria group bacterium]